MIQFTGMDPQGEAQLLKVIANHAVFQAELVAGLSTAKGCTKDNPPGPFFSCFLSSPLPLHLPFPGSQPLLPLPSPPGDFLKGGLLTSQDSTVEEMNDCIRDLAALTHRCKAHTDGLKEHLNIMKTRQRYLTNGVEVGDWPELMQLVED